MSAWSGRAGAPGAESDLGAMGTAGRDGSTPQPRRALSCARPARLPDPALNIWVSRGGPGRVRRSARLGSLPPSCRAPAFPSLPLLRTAGPLPGPLRVSPCWGAFSPAACSRGRSADPLLPSRSQRPRQAKILRPGTGCCSTASFLALPFFFFLFHYIEA